MDLLRSPALEQGPSPSMKHRCVTSVLSAVALPTANVVDTTKTCTILASGLVEWCGRCFPPSFDAIAFEVRRNTVVEGASLLRLLGIQVVEQAFYQAESA